MKSSVFASRFCTGCYGLVIVVSLTVMAGWLTLSETLIRIYPGFMPMQFNTAVGLGLCAVALLIGTRFRLAGVIVGTIVSLFGAATLYEYATGVNLGIDTFFVTPFTQVNVDYLGRIAPNTASAFLLTGMAIFLSSVTRNVRQSLLLAVSIISGIVIALSIVPLLGKLADVEVSNLVWGSSGHTAQHTAAAFTLLNLCILIQICRRNRNLLVWLPIPVFLIFAITTLALATTAHIQENNKFDNLLQSEARGIARKAQLQIRDLYKALDRISNRWSAAGGTPQPLWESDAKAYLDGYPFLTALTKTSADTQVEWAVPDEVKPMILGYKLNSEPVRAEAIGRVMSTHTPQTTHVLKLRTGEKGFLYISPLYVGDRYDGLQIAAFKLSTLFNGILDPDELKQVYLKISDENNEELFSTLPAGMKLDEHDHRQALIKNQGLTWTLQVAPTPLLLKSKNSFIAASILVIGLLTSGLMTLCAYLLTKWYLQNRVRQKLMADLATAEEFKKKIIDGSGYLIIATDINGTVRSFNKMAELLLGYDAAEIIGVTTPALWHVWDEVRRRAVEMSAHYGRAILPGNEVFTAVALLKGKEDREWTFVRKDGSRFPVRLVISVLRDEQGEATGFIGIGQDVSKERESAQERRLAEEKLRASEERLHLAISGTSDGLWDWDIATGEVFYSPRFMSELGYAEHELPYTIDTFSQIFLHPDDIELTFAAVAADHTHQKPYDVEYRMRHKDGHYIWFNARGQTVWDENDKPVRMTGFNTNIDNRKIAEEASKKAHDELNLIFSNVNAKIWFKDNRNNILRLNDAAARAMGGKVSDFENRNTAEFYPELAEKYLIDDLEVIESGKAKLGIIEQHKPKAGPVIWVSTDKIPYQNQETGESGVFVVAADITELKNSEQQREELVARLTESNTELGRFAYVASHDMQEPLRMIANFGALLGRDYAGQLDNDGREYLTIISQSALRMQQMVNDLLEYARVGNDATRFADVDLERELQHVKANLSASINEHQGKVTHDSLPKIKGNAVQLMRLIQNLISNGLKYQKEGSQATVHLGASDRGAFWQFSVTDNGIGMESKYAEQIFEPFKRLHSWQEYTGSGIGLAVCKKIIENHGGKIWVTSEPGKGSVFLFTLPKMNRDIE